MKRNEFKKWIRQLREERKALRRAKYLHDQTHVRIDPIRDNTRVLVGTSALGGGSTSFFIHDKVTRLRTLKAGDGIRTTPYLTRDFAQRGVLTMCYRWYFDDYALKPEQHSSGFKTVGPSCPTAVAWDGTTAGANLASKLRLVAQSALNAKVAGGFPSYDWLTDAVEAKQSLDLLRDSALRFEQLAIAIWKKDPKRVLEVIGIKPTRRKIKHVRNIIIHHWDIKSGKSVFNAASDIWMTYRYGFTPMIHSMEDALKATFGASQYKEYWNRFQVTLKDTWSSEVTQTNSANVAIKWNQIIKTSITASVRLKAFVRYTDGIKSRFAASPPIDLLNTVWEEVPFSFVIDWFYDIGGYFAGLRLEEIVGQVFVNQTEKGIWNQDVTIGNVTPYPKYRFTYVHPEWNSSYNAKSTQFARKVGSLSAVPPTLEQGLYGFKRLLDSASMSWQRTRRALDRDIDGKPTRAPWSNRFK